MSTSITTYIFPIVFLLLLLLFTPVKNFTSRFVKVIRWTQKLQTDSFYLALSSGWISPVLLPVLYCLLLVLNSSHHDSEPSNCADIRARNFVLPSSPVDWLFRHLTEMLKIVNIWFVAFKEKVGKSLADLIKMFEIDNLILKDFPPLSVDLSPKLICSSWRQKSNQDLVIVVFYQTNRKKYCTWRAEVFSEFLKIVLLSGGHKRRKAEIKNKSTQTNQGRKHNLGKEK